MAFLEERLPGCATFGYGSAPSYLVDVVRMQSGVEKRNRYWAAPLSRFRITITDFTDAVQELLEFWHAVGGRECGFRFKDWANYKSCRVNETITKLDQPLVARVGSPADYQLTKRYTFGTRTQDQPIFKPIQGTILIADNGTLKTEGVHYTIDYTTGQVSIAFSPVGTLTWGGEFDVPVRFDDDALPVTIEALSAQSVSFTLTEIRVP